MRTGNIVGVVVAAASLSIVSLYWANSEAEVARIPYDQPEMVSLGQTVYDGHCASCHGVQLEGEPNWRQRDAAGLLPAPPHDASGHTWHHADQMLFELTKYGIQRFAGADYVSKMPVYDGVITDEEIWAALAYIKSTWPDDIIKRHNEAFSDR